MLVSNSVLTDSSNCNPDKQYQRVSKKLKTISLIALMAFLVTFFAHAEHIVKQQQDSGEHCHFCQQNIDSPSELPKLRVITSAIYILVISDITVLHINAPSYLQPPLRAPPSF